MDELELPPFPPFSGPVPPTWDVRTTRGRAAERRHRLAVLNGACPQCIGGPGERDYRDFLRELARPQPYAEWGSGQQGQWLTPEGELAPLRPRATGSGRPRRPRALGPDGLHARGPGLRTLDDDRGHPLAPRVAVVRRQRSTARGGIEPRSLPPHRMHPRTRWPPVFRGSRICAPLDERLDAPFRPHWPTPPAEASVFLGLHQ